MSWQTVVVPNRYEDSVRLLGLARRLREREGVTAAEVFMATDANREELERRHSISVEAGPADVVVAVEADDDETAEAAASDARSHFEGGGGGDGATAERAQPRSLLSATRVVDANIALVSVPGEHASVEAAKALAAGLHVFLFSDHVSLQDEVTLKRAGLERELLVMGPGAGTAMLGGVALGFANVVERGPVGIVAAAGTGAQEVACLLDAGGVGVSHIIGVGGRDLSPAVGGAMMLAGARLLASDDGTEVIVLVSKPPAADVVAALERELPRDKPIVAGMVGHSGDDGELRILGTLEETVRAAVEAVGADAPAFDAGPAMAAAHEARERLASSQRALRGLYSGGTLCSEALALLAPLVGAVRSNVGGEDDGLHEVIDMGEEEFTVDRPHPMVDQTLRIERLAAEAAEPEVACVLLDVVLGYGAHDDPAEELGPAIADAREHARADERELVVVAHVCGTDADPQGRERQERALEEAGALVAPSNAAAVRVAAAVVAGDS